MKFLLEVGDHTWLCQIFPQKVTLQVLKILFSLLITADASHEMNRGKHTHATSNSHMKEVTPFFTETATYSLTNMRESTMTWWSNRNSRQKPVWLASLFVVIESIECPIRLGITLTYPNNYWPSSVHIAFPFGRVINRWRLLYHCDLSHTTWYLYSQEGFLGTRPNYQDNQILRNIYNALLPSRSLMSYTLWNEYLIWCWSTKILIL